MDTIKSRISGSSSDLPLRPIKQTSWRQHQKNQRHAGKHAGSEQHHDHRNFHDITFTLTILLGGSHDQSVPASARFEEAGSGRLAIEISRAGNCAFLMLFKHGIHLGTK